VVNEESEQMLNRGYLLKGETVEGAIDRITTAAAKRLYKPELIPAFGNDYQRLDFFRLQFGQIWEHNVVCLFLVLMFMFQTISKELHKLEVIMQTKIGGTSGYFGDCVWKLPLQIMVNLQERFLS
jgi:ribonucleoside-diphosphate reductase alpha chain